MMEKNKAAIILNNIEDIKTFAAEVSKFEADVNIRKNSTVYDAKSLLAIILLGGLEPVIVEINTDDEDILDLFQYKMSQFKIQ